MTDQPAFQDCYPDEVAHCFGCGRLNPHGHGLRSFWDGEESVAHFEPRPWHTAVPGYVYGGLIASLIDCHSTGTAAAATCRAAGQTMERRSMPRFLTASLKVDYLKPTPLGPLTLRGRVRTLAARKVVVETSVFADGDPAPCASGEVVCVRVPEAFMERLLADARSRGGGA